MNHFLLKPAKILLICVPLFLMGCWASGVPLVKEHKMPIDESLIGTWEKIEGSELSEIGGLVHIKKYSGTEYFIDTEVSLISFFRAYLIRLHGKLYLQVEERNKYDERKRYYFAKFDANSETLSLNLLDLDVEKDGLLESESLLKQVLEDEVLGDKDAYSGTHSFKRYTQMPE